MYVYVADDSLYEDYQGSEGLFPNILNGGEKHPGILLLEVVAVLTFILFV